MYCWVNRSQLFTGISLGCYHTIHRVGDLTINIYFSWVWRLESQCHGASWLHSGEDSSGCRLPISHCNPTWLEKMCDMPAFRAPIPLWGLYPPQVFTSKYYHIGDLISDYEFWKHKHPVCDTWCICFLLLYNKLPQIQQLTTTHVRYITVCR